MKIKKICPNCKKKVTILWEQVFGMRTLIEKNNKQYYQARCSECNYDWDIKK